MKPLTLFLFLSLSLAGFGQESVPIRWFPPEDTIRQKLDTVAVWLEYADTTKVISYNMTIPGYDIIDKNSRHLANYPDRIGHVAYLNHFKKPLPFLVWGVKERK